MNSRVALDGVGVAVDGGGLCYVALEEGVAVCVGLFGGTDVSVERVGGRADGQLLRSHWLGCWEEKAMSGLVPNYYETGTLLLQNT